MKTKFHNKNLENPKIKEMLCRLEEKNRLSNSQMNFLLKKTSKWFWIEIQKFIFCLS